MGNSMPADARTVIRNVKVFDDIRDGLVENADVIVDGSHIGAVSTSPVGDAPGHGTVEIDGGGRFLNPGMTDAHVHLMGNASNYLDFTMRATGLLFVDGSRSVISPSSPTRTRTFR
ncbi:hypothetical protein [Gordonia sp. NPDC003950]